MADKNLVRFLIFFEENFRFFYIPFCISFFCIVVLLFLYQIFEFKTVFSMRQIVMGNKRLNIIMLKV